VGEESRVDDDAADEIDARHEGGPGSHRRCLRLLRGDEALGRGVRLRLAASEIGVDASLLDAGDDAVADPAADGLLVHGYQLQDVDEGG
jgi:hypothetical protein